MQITRDEARRIAALANIHFDDDGLDRMAADMTVILEYVQQLEGVEVSEGATPAAVALALADDTPHDSVDRSAVEANAPAFRDGLFVVPRVVGGES